MHGATHTIATDHSTLLTLMCKPLIRHCNNNNAGHTYDKEIRPMRNADINYEHDAVPYI